MLCLEFRIFFLISYYQIPSAYGTAIHVTVCGHRGGHTGSICPGAPHVPRKKMRQAPPKAGLSYFSAAAYNSMALHSRRNCCFRPSAR